MKATISRRIASVSQRNAHHTEYPVAVTQQKLEDTEVAALWERFVVLRGTTGRREKLPAAAEELRNDLIIAYLPLLKAVAERRKQTLPVQVELGDLEQNGLMGLMDAINAFDPSMGTKFEAYAKQRIEGAILDGLRDMDHVSRRVHTNRKEIERTAKEIEIVFGRPATDMEVAEKLGIPLEELDRRHRENLTVTITSLDRAANESENGGKEMTRGDLIEDNRTASPLTTLEKKELIGLSTRGLSKKEKLIVVLYYLEELTMKEIGLVLNLSESRVCQLHNRIIAQLRRQLDTIRGDLLTD